MAREQSRITRMMYGRKEESIYSFTHLVGGLFMAFVHARYENMAKGVKIQEKVSEVIFNKLWSGWPCV